MPLEMNKFPKKQNSIRIAKKISQSGLGSRREVEKWIYSGRVSIDNHIINKPNIFVTKENKIKVDGKLIPYKEKTRLWKYNKPKGIIITRNDPQGRKTIFEDISQKMPYVISIGRLDINSEGLMLLTNNGNLAKYLEHPSQAFKRKYRVRVYGEVDTNKLNAIKNKFKIENFEYKPMEITIEKKQKSNTWLNITLIEGKNREIRKVMEHIGLQVNRLIRVSFGNFKLEQLKASKIIEVPEPEIKKINYNG